MEFIDALRYEYPKTFRLAVLSFFLLLSAVTFLHLPDNGFSRTVGVTAAQARVSALRYAVQWQLRAMIHPTGDAKRRQPLFGNVMGISDSGELIIAVPEGRRFVNRQFKIADAKVVDIHAVARTVASIRELSAKVEVYADNQAVVWLGDEPLNVKLVETGSAIPDPNPPTNIVDLAFSAYYWKKVKGNG